MYALVANGIQTICKTQRQLEVLISIYPYPKFRKCISTEDARKWIREHQRSDYTRKIEKYGNTVCFGYAAVQYKILEDRIWYKVDTSKIGLIKIKPSETIMVDNRGKSIIVVYTEIKLTNDIISHHVLAIRKILKLLGTFIDVDVVVPDISVYLAIKKYTGGNYIIKGIQRDIANRLGEVSITVDEVIL